VSSAPDRLPPTVIFLHITKTAGTTVAQVAQRQYASERFLRSDHDFSAFRERLARMPDLEKSKIDCLFGHMAFGLHRFLPRPAVYATLLREPVDRVISHYYYAINATDHPLHRRVIDARMTFEDYLRSGILEELNDGQVRRLSGLDEGIPYGSVPRTLLDAAKRNLRDHFAVVGLTERFDASMLLLARVLGWTTTDYVTLNVTPSRPSRSSIPADLRRLAERYNALDAELYVYARGLFEEQLARHDITRTTAIGFRVRRIYRTIQRQIVKVVSRRSQLSGVLWRVRRNRAARG
jgi:hypothetical protein